MVPEIFQPRNTPPGLGRAIQIVKHSTSRLRYLVGMSAAVGALLTGGPALYQGAKTISSLVQPGEIIERELAAGLVQKTKMDCSQILYCVEQITLDLRVHDILYFDPTTYTILLEYFRRNSEGMKDLNFRVFDENSRMIFTDFIPFDKDTDYTRLQSRLIDLKDRTGALKIEYTTSSSREKVSNDTLYISFLLLWGIASLVSTRYLYNLLKAEMKQKVEELEKPGDKNDPLAMRYRSVLGMRSIEERDALIAKLAQYSRIETVNTHGQKIVLQKTNTGEWTMIASGKLDNGYYSPAEIVSIIEFSETIYKVIGD